MMVVPTIQFLDGKINVVEYMIISGIALLLTEVADASHTLKLILSHLKKSESEKEKRKT